MPTNSVNDRSKLIEKKTFPEVELHDRLAGSWTLGEMWGLIHAYILSDTDAGPTCSWQWSMALQKTTHHDHVSSPHTQ